MTFTSRRVALPTGISLHVREQGEGGPTTLLSGGCTGASAGKLAGPRRARDCADLRGTGFSQKPREGYTLEDDVRDVVALIDTLGLTDVVLVGHSKGGAIAQRVALERPAALRKLVLVCSCRRRAFRSRMRMRRSFGRCVDRAKGRRRSWD